MLSLRKESTMDNNLLNQQTANPVENPSSSMPIQPTVTSSLNTNIPDSSGKSKKKLIIILIACVLVIVIVVTGFLLVSKKDTKQPENITKKQKVLSAIDTSSIKSAYDGFYKNGIIEFDAKSKDGIIANYQELTKDFKVTEEFTTDKSILLISLGIAQQASLAKDKEPYQYEMYLLAKPYLDSKPARIDDDEFTETQTDEEAKAIYAKYTDKDLTKKVRDTISSKNLLKDINTKLMIGQSEQKTYDIFVLNFDSKSTAEKQFAKDMKMSGWVPPLWNDRRASFNYIIFSKDQANSLLDPSDQESALGKILHEYTHSQSNYSRGEYVTYSLEERRAEFFSGDTAAYYDVKGFFTYINVFSGFDILELMEQYPSNAGDFYQTIYQTLGVELANKIVMAIPVPYLVDEGIPIKKMQEVSGNYNSALEAAYKLGEKNKTEQSKRIKERADKLLGIFGSKDKVISDLQNNTKDNYRLDFAAEKMIDYLN